MLAPQTPQTEWPADGLEYLGLCPVCGSRDRETQYANLRDRLFSAAGTWTLYRCLACEVRYLDPRPNRATIGTAYSAYYTHAESSPSHSAGLLSRFKLSLRNGYLNHVWHTSFTPSLTFVAKCLSAIYPDWASTYERLAVRELPRISGGRLLDIGCGSGNFLVLAKKLGWSVCGIDFDRKALEIARQHDIDVRLGGLEIFADERELFDVITSNHVIEHVHDPKEMLNSCRRLLKKGGMLRIESPNFNSTGSRLFGQNWRGLEAPRHLVLFNSDNMKQLLTKAGFVNIRHSGWMPQFELMYQASKNLQNGDAPETRNLNVHEQIRIKLIDSKLKRDASQREFFTYICYK